MGIAVAYHNHNSISVTATLPTFGGLLSKLMKLEGGPLWLGGLLLRTIAGHLVSPFQVAATSSFFFDIIQQNDYYVDKKRSLGWSWLVFGRILFGEEWCQAPI